MKETKWIGAVVVFGAGLLLAACGSTASTKATSAKTPTASSGSTALGTSKFPAPFRRKGHFRPPAAAGEIAAISPSESMQVQGTTTGESTVKWGASTTFAQTVTTKTSSLRAGECVSAVEVTPSGSSTPRVRALTILPATNGCSAATSPTGGTRPGGTFGSDSLRKKKFKIGGFKVIVGTVKTVEPGSVVVTQTKGSTVVTIPVSSTTIVKEHLSATASDLAVGKCVTVKGTTNSIGVVTAKSIAISNPTNGSCSALRGGFGRRRAFGGGGGFGGGGASA